MLDLLILDIELSAGELAAAETAFQRRVGSMWAGRNRLSARLLRQGHLAGWADCLSRGRQVARREVEREMDGEVLELHRAQPTVDGRPVPSLTIRIGAEVPEKGRIDDEAVQTAVELFRREGRTLARALWSSLPGGTLDELIAALLRRRASMFRVTFGDGPRVEELEAMLARQRSRGQALARKLDEAHKELRTTRRVHELWLRSLCQCELDEATHVTNTSLCPVHGDPDRAPGAGEPAAAANQDAAP